MKSAGEKSGAAEPGTQQAVSAAVGSIARGAAEGHPRLQEALDLLKKNKIAEATQLLNASRRTSPHRPKKTARKRQSPIAISAPSRVLPTPSARKAYEKALALDPDDAEGFLAMRWFQLDAEISPSAEKSYRTLIQLADKGADDKSDILGHESVLATLPRRAAISIPRSCPWRGARHDGASCKIRPRQCGLAARACIASSEHCGMQERR